VGAPAFAAGPNDPPPQDEPKPKPRPRATEPAPLESLDVYRVAYRAIYHEQDYQRGIVLLRSLGRDDNAEVANLIGFASRKLGGYDDARHWYEKALASNPKHARTWSYYGMWHVENGNTLKALDYLETVRAICGTDCREYTELKEVIAGTRSY
jgi:tetratricopeptide (TPR) repeat protein